MKKSWNKLYNRGLWTCVQHILHGVASDLIDNGALYVNTDGYIVRDRHLETAKDIIREWGLPFSIKAQGDTEIYGVGRYKVGLTTTNTQLNPTIGKENIKPMQKDWLRFRIAKASKFRM